MAHPYHRAIYVLPEISQVFLCEQINNINEIFITTFKSIFEFRISSHFMYCKDAIGSNMHDIVFLKIVTT